ncbi:MAG: lipoprotein [Campylobacterales bacterium]
MFHTAIIAAIFLTGCGYKGDPVYKEGNTTIEYNATGAVADTSRM